MRVRDETYMEVFLVFNDREDELFATYSQNALVSPHDAAHFAWDHNKAPKPCGVTIVDHDGSRLRYELQDGDIHLPFDRARYARTFHDHC